MIRYRGLFAILSLILGGGLAFTGEGFFESLGIPTVQQQKSEVKPTAPTPGDTEPGIFDVSVEETAGQLYQQALDVEKRGRTARAVEMLLTLLEQCPSFDRREEVEGRLRAIADRWLDAARQTKRLAQADRGLLHVDTRATSEFWENPDGSEVEAWKILDTMVRLARRKILDPEMFVWDDKGHEYPEGWDWVEDVFLEVPVFHQKVPNVPRTADGFWIGHETINYLPTNPSRRYFSSLWKRQVIMQFECDVEIAWTDSGLSG